jgi:dynein heavy chain
LIKASIDIYTDIKARLLPTPAKCHYTFNLRDLSKVIQGVLQMSHHKYSNVDDLVRLWAHEQCRIFHDRLAEAKDKTTFFEILLSKLQLHADEFVLSPETVDNLIFSDIADNSREYTEVTDMNSPARENRNLCKYVQRKRDKETRPGLLR